MAFTTPEKCIAEDMGWVITDSADSPSDSVLSATVPANQTASQIITPIPTPGLNTDLAVEYPIVSMEPCELQAVLSVVAPPVADSERACLRLVAVLDKSGSMRGEKLQLVVKTMQFMLRHLSERDALGLVAYDTNVSVLAPLTYCNAEGRERLELVLKRLSAGSQTNLSGGLIQGLELHKQGVAKTKPMQQQRARFGNTYRQLTEEEVTRSRDGRPQHHTWTMELRCESAEDAALVSKVVYTLHESFANPVVEVMEPPFELTRIGWGTFIVRADIHLQDGRILKLEHELSFGQPERFRTVLLPLRAAPSACDDMPEATDGLVRSTFLFTDGLANVGITDTERISQSARNILQDLGDFRCTVSTFGFGTDHNADLLKNLSDIGEGIYSYVENEDQIGQAFGEALGGLLTTTHQNVRLSLQLEPNIGSVQTVTVYPVEGPKVNEDGTKVVEIVLGDLYAEERRDVLISMKLPVAESEGFTKIGNLCARGFSVLNARFENTSRADFGVGRQSDGGSMTPAQCHPQVMRHRNRQLAVKAIDDARSEATRGNLAAARHHLDAAIEALSVSPLTVQGDAACLGFLTDLNDCLKDIRSESEFRSYGSKTLSNKSQAHGKQRACYGQEFSAMYANKRMHFMKLECKAAVRNNSSDVKPPITGNQSNSPQVVAQVAASSTSRSQTAVAASSNTAGYPAADNSALANFFQRLLSREQEGAKTAEASKDDDKSAEATKEVAKPAEAPTNEPTEGTQATSEGAKTAEASKDDDNKPAKAPKEESKPGEAPKEEPTDATLATSGQYE